jgi:ribosomal protein S27AE
MDPLRATIEEFAAEGYTHIECMCPRCRAIRLRPMSWLPRISMGLTLAALSARLPCGECGGPVRSVKPWRQADVLGKPLGRRG